MHTADNREIGDSSSPKPTLLCHYYIYNMENNTTISTRDRFLIGFISSLFLPFVKLYQNGSLLDAAANHYFIGLAGPFVFLGLLMGVYALAVEKDETDTKRLFRTCFAMPGVLLSVLGTSSGNTSGTAQAYTPPEQIKCHPHIEMVQGLIDTYDALTNNHRYRFLLLDEDKPSKRYLVHKDKKYWITAKFTTEPKESGLYFDLRDCHVFKKD